MSDDPKPLSLRHRRFVAEYLKDLNATQAYLRAGYAPRGAQANASKLLQRPRVQAAVEAGQQRVAQALEVTVARLAQEYARIAFANVDDFVTVDDDGRVRVDLAKADRAKRAGLLELTVTDDGEGRPQRVKIKLGKLQALDALARLKSVGLDAPAAAPDVPPPDKSQDRPPVVFEGLGPIDTPETRAQQQQQETMPGMPTEPPLSSLPGPHLNGKIFWSTRRRSPEPDEIPRMDDPYDPFREGWDES